MIARPESFSSWIPLAVSGVTGGLAGAILTNLVNFLIAKNNKKQERLKQLSALKEELSHARWLAEYNHGRIRSTNIVYKALSPIDTRNVEHVLFGASNSLTLKPDLQSDLHDYLEQTIYLNKLIDQYWAVMPSNPQMVTPLGPLIGEIQAICTPDDTYRPDDPEPSLRARIAVLLSGLAEIKL